MNMEPESGAYRSVPDSGVASATGTSDYKFFKHDLTFEYLKICCVAI